jgi:hypothetical protein
MCGQIFKDTSVRAVTWYFTLHCVYLPRQIWVTGPVMQDIASNVISDLCKPRDQWCNIFLATWSVWPSISIATWSVWPGISSHMIRVARYFYPRDLCGQFPATWSLWAGISSLLICVARYCKTSDLCGQVFLASWSVWQDIARPVICVARYF